MFPFVIYVLGLGVCLYAATPSPQTEIHSSLAKVTDTLAFVRRTNITKLFQTFLRSHTIRLQKLHAIYKARRQLLDLLLWSESRPWTQITTGGLDDLTLPIHHPLFVLRFVQLQLKCQESLATLPSNATARFDDTPLRQLLQRLPGKADIDGAAIGIMRLQHVYQLSMTDMINGVIAGHPSVPLTTPEALDLVNATAFASKDIRANMLNASLRMLHALNESRGGADMCNEDMTAMLLTMARIYQQAQCVCNDEFSNIRNQLEALNYTDTGNAFQSSFPDYHCPELVSINNCKAIMDAFPVDKNEDNYNKLCRRGLVKEPNEQDIKYVKDSMFENQNQLGITTQANGNVGAECRLVHNNHPYLILQPTKVEVLKTQKPYIAVLHDIMSQRDITFVKRQTKHRLARAYVTGNRGEQMVTYDKTSQSAKITKVVAKQRLHNFQARLLAVTGLSYRSFEDIVVANYGIGGAYRTHADHKFPAITKDFSEKSDNRLCSVVTYLSDVEHGGQTVFPELGLRSEPIEGSAVVFYNLFRNGSGNMASVHGSCPVLYGEKWIANQFIMRNENMLSYPCTLSSLD